jgi:hypothetical protein
MPASGYELAMGTFAMVGIGTFLLGWGLVLLLGWLLREK